LYGLHLAAGNGFRVRVGRSHLQTSSTPLKILYALCNDIVSWRLTE
jgi:hypothetical protein